MYNTKIKVIFKALLILVISLSALYSLSLITKIGAGHRQSEKRLIEQPLSFNLLCNFKLLVLYCCFNGVLDGYCNYDVNCPAPAYKEG